MVSMKNGFSKKSIILKSVIIIIMAWLLYFIFYIPSREREFMNAVGIRFNNTNADKVLVKEVTSFDWDSVCYIEPYSTKSHNFIEKDYQSILNEHLPVLGWPSSYGSYVFIKNKIVTEEYTFPTMGFRYIKNRFYPMALIILIDNNPYSFMGAHNFENDSCISSENAAFKKEYLPQWNEYKILITNVNKESK